MQRSWGERFIAVISVIIFTATAIIGSAVAAPISLPLPSDILPASPSYTPVLLKGLTIDAQNPFAFRFVADAAETGLEGQALQEETSRLVRYFITSLAIPESDMWVNLSPLEKDRIIPDMFGKTEMGRDLLAQDYILKQVTAGFLNPENEVGRKFWDKVYESANDNDQSVQEAVESFNKVWIVPDQASVYQHGNSVFVGEARLKVMMEGDYEAQSQTTHDAPRTTNDIKDAFREIIIPAIEREVNEGKNFAPLRQVYNAMLLAVWYKKVLKESVLGGVFVDRQNIRGIDPIGRDDIESIYNRYVDAFQKGASSVIAERYDPASGQIVPQMYFSGGAIAYNRAQLNVTNQTQSLPYFSKNIFDVPVDLAQMAKPLADALNEMILRIKPGATDAQRLEELQKAAAEEGLSVEVNGVADFTFNADGGPRYRVYLDEKRNLSTEAWSGPGDAAMMAVKEHNLPRLVHKNSFRQVLVKQGYVIEEIFEEGKKGFGVLKFTASFSDNQFSIDFGPNGNIQRDAKVRIVKEGMRKVGVSMDFKEFQRLLNLDPDKMSMEEVMNELALQMKNMRYQERFQNIIRTAGSGYSQITQNSKKGPLSDIMFYKGEITPKNWSSSASWDGSGWDYSVNDDNGNAAMMTQINGGIDLKGASGLVDVVPGGTMVFPRMADFSEAQFDFENVSPHIGLVSPMPRSELDRLLGMATQ